MQVVPGNPLLPNLTKNRVKPPIGRKPSTKLSPSSSTVSASMELQGSAHLSTLKQVNREPEKSSSQRHSAKVSFQLDMPVAPKKMMEHKHLQEKLHSQHVQPSFVKQQQQTRFTTQPSAHEHQQPREEEKEGTVEKPQGRSPLQPSAKQKRRRPKKKVSLEEFSSETEVDHNQLETEVMIVQEEPPLLHGQSITTTAPRPTAMRPLEEEFPEKQAQSKDQQIQAQKLHQKEVQQHWRQKEQQQQDQEGKSQQWIEEEQQQREQSRKQRQRAEQKETNKQKLHLQQKKQEQNQVTEMRRQQQQPTKKQLEQKQKIGDNSKKQVGIAMEPLSHTTTSGHHQQPIPILQTATNPTAASASLQLDSAPPVPQQDEEPPLTLSLPPPVAVVEKTTSSGPSTNANLQHGKEEEVPELEPISIDETMPQEKDEEHEQLIHCNQQVSIYVCLLNTAIMYCLNKGWLVTCNFIEMRNLRLYAFFFASNIINSQQVQCNSSFFFQIILPIKQNLI